MEVFHHYIVEADNEMELDFSANSGGFPALKELLLFDNNLIDDNVGFIHFKLLITLLITFYFPFFAGASINQHWMSALASEFLCFESK